MSRIPRHEASDPVDDMWAALDEAGCLVVTDVTDTDLRDRLRRELEPHMPEAGGQTGLDDPEAFYPGHTRRMTALIARSEESRKLATHPLSMDFGARHLGPGCEHFQLHVTAALEVGPGARRQVLHREEDPFTFFPLPRPNLILASMWAITDFRADNGGTQLVPGSHRWGVGREAEPGEIALAEMPAGSVLYWLGGTLHGAGANTAGDWRYGVILTYSLGWLRQEENQALDVPSDLAATFSPELQRLTSRTMHGALGFFDPRVGRPVPASPGERR
ncbi:MAG: phytanoyl-CoA dioxygenase family protein [Myxococcota bacterium]|nr:phytanoyl-CoA dioxygenase family protein [Myxococcota bacterium]